MKAAFFTEYGPARQVLRLGDLPDPQPRLGEVRVRMRFSGINPSDCNRRAGIRDRPGYQMIVPHNDGAGEIDAVGEGVSPERVGERVWVWSAQRGRPFGTASEYVTLPSAQAVHLPDNTSLEAGACIGVPAMTAYYSLFADGPIEGSDALVTGGAGAVGLYAVQFAMLAGARSVITTVSGDAKAKIVAETGAPVIINYRTEDVAARIMRVTEGRGIDRISEVDFGGNLATTLAVMSMRCALGAYASKGAPEPTLPFYPFLFKDIVLRFLQCHAMPEILRAEATREVTRWCEEDRLVHPAPTILPLEAIAEAHELVDSGSVIGKVMLAMRL